VSCQVEIGAKAGAQLAAMDAGLGAGVERRIQWLAENAPAWSIAALSACPRIWRDSVSSASAITASSTGFIRQKSCSAFTAPNTALKSIVRSDPCYRTMLLLVLVFASGIFLPAGSESRSRRDQKGGPCYSIPTNCCRKGMQRSQR